MKEYNLKPNIDFLNLLMRRRLKRNEHENAEVFYSHLRILCFQDFKERHVVLKKAIEMIQTYQLAPNIITFGCMANKVTSTKILIEFLKDLKVSVVIGRVKTTV